MRFLGIEVKEDFFVFILPHEVNKGVASSVCSKILRI